MLLFLAQKSGVDFVFYDLFCELCKKKGISVTKATVEIGLSRTIGTKWKNTGAVPNGETLNKIADYFGVTTDYLLTGEQKEKAPTPRGEREIGMDDFTYAFFNESKDLPEEKKKMLLDMARFMKADIEKEKGH